jgi:hypothetical protein
MVVTNAHVLGMVEGDSRRPQLIEVVIDSAEENSRTVKAIFFGMDRTCDLAVIRAQGTDLPEPLRLGTAADLTETQSVFIFGSLWEKTGQEHHRQQVQRFKSAQGERNVEPDSGQWWNASKKFGRTGHRWQGPGGGDGGGDHHGDADQFCHPH